MRSLVSLGATAALALLAATALADSRDRVTADALFREGRELLKNKNYAEACPKLAESYRLDPAPGTLYNLAECEEKQGILASALQRWQALVDLLTASKRLNDPRLPAARQKAEGLGKRVPRLTLKLKTSQEVVVLRDGVELRGASLGAALPVDPGEHLVIVRAAYRRDGEYRFSLKESEEKVLEIEPGEPDGTEPKPPASASAAPAATAPPPATTATATATTAPTATDDRPPPPSSRRTLGLVVGGAGAAVLVGAGVTGLMLRSRKDDVANHCEAGTKLCDDTGYDAASSGKTLAPINLALWVVGAVGVGAGAYLFFSAPRVQPGISASREQSMLWLQGRF